MAVTELGQTQTFKASSNIAGTDYQYCPVILSGIDTVDYAGANGKVIGILMNKPINAGDAAEVLTASGVKCKCKVADIGIAFSDALEAEGTSAYRATKFTINTAGTTTYLIGYSVDRTTTKAGAIITIITCFAPTGY